MSLNKRKTRSRITAPTHQNYEGGDSFSINDPFTKLRVAATSCFFGEPAYYVKGESEPKGQSSLYGYDPYRGRSIFTANARTAAELVSRYGGELVPNSEWQNLTTREIMEQAIDAALDADVERTLQFAVELRNVWHIRATSQVIMVRAAMHANASGTTLISDYAGEIMVRLDEVMNQISYYEQIKGSLKGIPSRLKRAWARRLQAASQYELAKYRMTNRSVNVYDAVNLTHPRSTEALSALMGNSLRLGGEGTMTWESIRSAGGTWTEAGEVMGHMALLRNLRNMAEDGSLTTELLTKLKGGVEKGRQLPFRYWSAFKAVEGVADGSVLDAIEECFEISTQRNLPHFEGRGLAICDISGSMSQEISGKSTVKCEEIARLMSVITARVFDDSDIYLFGTDYKKLSLRARQSPFSQVKDLVRAGVRLGHGTNLISPLRDLISQGVVYDHIFVYSDMQCGYDGNVADHVLEYRRKVNKNAKFYFVNLAGYTDSLVPEFFNGTYMLGGWSDRILSFAKEMGILTNAQSVKG